MEAKKSLGQHFLHDAGVLVKIKEELEDAKKIVEIGGGRGALTEYVSDLNVPLTVVELDSDLSLYLRDKFKNNYNVNIVNEDASVFKLNEPVSLVGNLPYNMAKRIIRNFIFQKNRVEKMVFMVQKEVADSIVAKTGTKEYYKFSVFVQLFCEVRKLFNVKKGAFYPPPKVESSVIEMIPYKTNALQKDIDDDFFDFLNVLFSHPRKTIRNNLKGVRIKNTGRVERFLNKRPKELFLEDIFEIYSGCYNE